jgi:hypothetical protein
MYTTRSSGRNVNKENQDNISTKNSIDTKKNQKPFTSITELVNNEQSKKTIASKSSAAKMSNPALNRSLTDFTCPICLEVLVEPVQMPCNHELCLPCFKTITDKVNLLCPMCRMRISSWSRANANSLVNKERWKEIQTLFPKEIKDRLEGRTAIRLAKELKENKFASSKEVQHSLTEPGEIRKEYEEYVRRENERIRLEKEQEEKKSLELIEKIMKEEQNISLNEYVNLLNAENNSNENQYETRHMHHSRIFNSSNTASNFSASRNNNSNILSVSNFSLNSSNSNNSMGTSSARSSRDTSIRESRILNSTSLRGRDERTTKINNQSISLSNLNDDDSNDDSETTLGNNYSTNESLQSTTSSTSPKAYDLRSKRTISNNSLSVNINSSNTDNDMSVVFESQSSSNGRRTRRLSKRRRI